MSSFEGKVIAITGGASGIGLALAQTLHRRGAKVSIADTNPVALEAVPSAVGTDDIIAYRCDVRDMNEVRAWLKHTIDRWGRLDGAANMAGIFGSSPGRDSIENQTEHEWNVIIDVNLKGTMNCMKAELEWLKTGSSIVNAASVGGTRGLVGSAAYCASKHGIIGLTRASAKDFGPRGIRINAVAPGYIDTPMQRRAEAGHESLIAGHISTLPIQRKAEAEEVAKVVCFLLSEESSFVTGSVYDVDGGYQA